MLIKRKATQNISSNILSKMTPNKDVYYKAYVQAYGQEMIFIAQSQRKLARMLNIHTATLRRLLDGGAPTKRKTVRVEVHPLETPGVGVAQP